MRATLMIRIVYIVTLVAILVATQQGAWAAAKQPDKEVPMELRDIIEDAIAPKLVLPETALWNFEYIGPYPGGAKVVCGRVNYQSAMRRYVGAHRFYAIMDGKSIDTLQLEDPPSTDVSGQQAAKFRMLCDEHG